MDCTSETSKANTLKTPFIFIVFVIIAVLPRIAFSQSENVPVSHPVYDFLKRMEVKGWIERYHDAVLPLSRREVAGFLSAIRTAHHKEKETDTITIGEYYYSEYGRRLPPLGATEQEYLERYYSEFAFDAGDSSASFTPLFDDEGTRSGVYINHLSEPNPRYLYALADSNLTFFVNGLLNFAEHRITGDALGSTHAEYVQFGGRIRGTIYDHLGYFLEGKNASFWGSRQLLQRDRVIGQAYTLGVTNVKNFDFVEGYVRYNTGMLSLQLGRERVLWGTGFDQKMVLSDNIRVPDFVRGDVQYKSLKYTFMHAWIMGKRSSLLYTLPSDTSATFVEPVVADKYFAAHRLEFSFPGVLDVGAQEMVIYSNRSPDLAYFNPLTLIESAQRSREERDNVFWAFDIQTRPFTDVELSATFLLDDLNFPDLTTDKWSNRWGAQASLFYASPFALANTSLIIEYTRIAPYVFAHNRSRENDYGSLGALLGPRIGPNADAWFFRLDVLPHRNFTLSLRVGMERSGENEVDPTGKLLRNVGGDFLQPHRDADADHAPFLDGILMKTTRAQLMCTYEVVRQCWADLMIEHEIIRNTTTNGEQKNTLLLARLRLEL
jgi:hypothetical protein